MKDIGSPLDDALRRDFTINSLFFNINTGDIEDYTERGLNDIKNHIIRTPI
jgi:tRNA nucleotidyltransferase (CCA-adding enzyme)